VGHNFFVIENVSKKYTQSLVSATGFQVIHSTVNGEVEVSAISEE
jgi:hypothetical protein